MKCVPQPSHARRPRGGVRICGHRRRRRPACGISRPPATRIRAAISHFRITATDGSDPVDITVPVIMGASEDAMARSIRRSLGSQLRRDRYSVQLGEGANVLVSDPRGRPNFTLELVDSDIENVRVAVQSVTPAASPTVPSRPCRRTAGAGAGERRARQCAPPTRHRRP